METALQEESVLALRNLVEERTGLVFEGEAAPQFAARLELFRQQKRLDGAAAVLAAARGSATLFDEFLHALADAPARLMDDREFYAIFEHAILPELRTRKFFESPRSLRIWCVGCGGGEGAYSVAIAVAESQQFSDAWSVCILGTDVDRNALKQAARGVFDEEALAGLTSEQKDRYFIRVRDQGMVAPHIRHTVSFAPMNLAHSAYVGRCDCIFALDALRYLRPGTRAAVLQHFLDDLEPGGYLVLPKDACDSGCELARQASLAGHAMVYQKPVAQQHPAAIQVSLKEQA